MRDDGLSYINRRKNIKQLFQGQLCDRAWTIYGYNSKRQVRNGRILFTQTTHTPFVTLQTGHRQTPAQNLNPIGHPSANPTYFQTGGNYERKI